MLFEALRRCRFEDAREHLSSIRAILLAQAVVEVPRMVFCIPDELEMKIHDSHLSCIMVHSLYSSAPGGQGHVASSASIGTVHATSTLSISAGIKPGAISETSFSL